MFYKKKKEDTPLEVLIRKAPDFIPEKTHDEKWRAAYALNLCTVSVSQIVEYDDIRTLDQEYNTILNNLNLQNMPKDDALLDVLKQLLDVITFFKIQEGDKKMLEKEYQHKMKNAIWNAVPNMSVVLTTPDPKVMLFNLATQVGIGYMNYRKEKANAQLEQDKQKWQLMRSAMEQLNSLRRELFDTAWRLSKEYNFDDKMRLSERQIEQYNKILLDNEPARKYERLLSIQQTFEAYPPFWFYLGHAANEIHKHEEAAESFYKFLKLTGNKTKRQLDSVEKSNLLREDHLCASCALELAGLVSDDKDEMIALLELSVKASGGAPDVLQMCAMTYISAGATEKAIEILRYLVNESYNVDLNANLISRLYFDQILLRKPEAYRHYNELKCRKDAGAYMINIPETIPAEGPAQEEIIKDYFRIRRKELETKRRHLIGQIDKKSKKDFFNLCEQDGNIAGEFAEFLQSFNNIISELFRELSVDIDVQTVILSNAGKVNKEINLREFATTPATRTKKTIDVLYAEFISKGIIDELDQKLLDAFSEISVENIYKSTYLMDSFCLKNNLPMFVESSFAEPPNSTSKFLTAIYSEENIQKVLKQEARRDACLSVIKKYKDVLLLDAPEDKLYFTVKGEVNFNRYKKHYGSQFSEIHDEHDEVLAVLNDRTWSDRDLVFTTKGYFLFASLVTKGSSKRNFVRYSDEIGYSSRKENTIEVKDLEYHNKYVNIDKLCDMIRELAEKTRNL